MALRLYSYQIMNKVIPSLPNEIVDKIFKEFCGYAGYRISKTGKVFVWKKIKMDDFRYTLFKIRQKALRFGQRIEHPGNYEVRCPLSDIYKKNDNYNKAFEKSTKRMPKLLGNKPKKVDGYSLTKPYNPGNRIKL